MGKDFVPVSVWPLCKECESQVSGEEFTPEDNVENYCCESVFYFQFFDKLYLKFACMHMQIIADS